MGYENNPKYANHIIKQPKAFKKANGLGVVQDISFYSKDFLDTHPDIIVGKKSGSPDEDKSLADSKALIPVLRNFFKKHPFINPKTFLDDAAFDSI